MDSNKLNIDIYIFYALEIVLSIKESSVLKNWKFNSLIYFFKLDQKNKEDVRDFFLVNHQD